ncbi:MAG: hypothetical protein KA196_09850 [Arenimonas sp.]|nr:hypothetical protein [Arenimonas sp.]
MKSGLALVLSLLIVLLAGLMPAPARAIDSYDCTDGCYVITCNDEVCVTWFCDGRGCRMMNSWPRDQAQPQTSRRPGKPAKPATGVAYAKVCLAGKACELYELNTVEAVHLGSFDNIDDLIQYRETLRETPVRLR